jgi:multimeric flavodoxin WrbA/protein-tyrosine-phosphatase
MFVLGLQGSPRKGGNTDIFVNAFLERAAQEGAVVRTIQAARAGVVPCKGCGYCETHGRCIIADDPMSTDIFGLIRQADLVVAASPVYFYGISAQLKVLIDRCQTLWSRKYVYKLKDPLAGSRQGLLFSVAASRGKQLFDGVHLTAKYFFDAIDARYVKSITYRGVEAKGAIRQQERLAEDIEAAMHATVAPLVKRRHILFVSPHGACRAPLAAAMAQRQHGDRIRTDYAGQSPIADLDTSMVEAMSGVGVDMGYRRPQAVEAAFMGARPDLAVIIGDSTLEASLPGVKTIQWNLPAPASAHENAMARLQGEIDTQIETLMSTLD